MSGGVENASHDGTNLRPVLLLRHYLSPPSLGLIFYIFYLIYQLGHLNFYCADHPSLPWRAKRGSFYRFFWYAFGTISYPSWYIDVMLLFSGKLDVILGFCNSSRQATLKGDRLAQRSTNAISLLKEYLACLDGCTLCQAPAFSAELLLPSPSLISRHSLPHLGAGGAFPAELQLPSVATFAPPSTSYRLSSSET